MSNLYEDTIKLAESTDLKPQVVCNAIGVTTRWYQMVLSGEIKDPGVRRMQRLHDYLKAKGPAAESPTPPCQQSQEVRAA